MPVADARVRRNLSIVDADTRTRRTVPLERAASRGIGLLLLVAPFEAVRPLLRLPGQNLSTVETALLALFVAVVVVAWRDGTWPRVDARAWAPWACLVGVAAIASVTAPVHQANALHMTARLALAAVLCALTATASTDRFARSAIVTAAVTSGVVVAALVVADFGGSSAAASFLSLFRDGVASVGAQVRASGPFQYPTIASMYLEVACALGLGVLAEERQAGLAKQVVLVLALSLIVEGIVLTFTRSGLITVALSIGLVATAHVRRHGVDRTAWCLAAVTLMSAVALLSSRSAEALVLRMTSETQTQWFSARIDAPAHLSFDGRGPVAVPLRVTNTGRATWDSTAPVPVTLSYHWIDERTDAVRAWEGIRTVFPVPVRPGERADLTALVDAPVGPGHYRLVWDLEQEHRLWFSTEPGATLALTAATVTGQAPSAVRRVEGGPARMPVPAVRPGRLVLWTAAWRMWRERPWLGVGPDNFRLLYGPYASIVKADPRIHSNNTYIELIVGMGLAGAAALAWLAAGLARAVRRCVSSGGVDLGVAAACVSIAVHGLTDSFLSFTGTYIVMAVAFGLATAGPQAERHAHRI